jgi:nitrate reductase cytochrome c-type subunit
MRQSCIGTIRAVLLVGAVALAGGCAPTIPHAVQSQDAASCLSCHADGTQGAKKTSHPERQNCLECHKPSQ